jgi:hypothetical protein
MERVALGVDIKNPRTRNKRPLPTDSLDLSVFEARRRASSAASRARPRTRLGWRDRLARRMLSTSAALCAAPLLN